MLRDWPELMAVDQFGGCRPVVAYQPGNLLDGHATVGQQGHEAVRSSRGVHSFSTNFPERSNSSAHMDASLRMLDNADELLAVWDGQPARGYGGTADVVKVVRDQGIPVTVVWPEGAVRD